MFNANNYKGMYSRILGPLAQPVTLMVNNGTGYDSYENVSAHISKWKENELVKDGSIELGDLKLIILADDLPSAIGHMSIKDRIKIDGNIYAVIHWDVFSRSVGAESVAVQATVRGGGSA
jgi:hypothetical protein